jgi:hypothetical protein
MGAQPPRRPGGRARPRGKAEPFAAEELADPDKTEILRAHLKRWGAEVAGFFDVARAKSPDEDLRGVAPQHPVFRVVAPP